MDPILAQSVPLISMRLIPLANIATCFALLSACDTGPHELRLVTPTEPVDASIVEEFSALLDADASVSIQLTATALSEEAALEVTGDPINIAVGLRDLIQNSELCRKMGGNARDLFDQFQGGTDIVMNRLKCELDRNIKSIST